LRFDQIPVLPNRNRSAGFRTAVNSVLKGSKELAGGPCRGVGLRGQVVGAHAAGMFKKCVVKIFFAQRRQLRQSLSGDEHSRAPADPGEVIAMTDSTIKVAEGGHSLTLTVCILVFAVSVANGEVALNNPSFEKGLDEQGLPRYWEGDASSVEVVDVELAGVSKAARIAGGGISQTVAATGGLDYTLTVQARTELREEEANSRFRSKARLALTFLPSGEVVRTEMASPFGDSRRFVEYAVGGSAPAGADRVRITIHAGPSEMLVDDVKLTAVEASYTSFKLKEMHIDTAIVAEGRPVATIVAPEEGRYGELARAIARRIRELTGAATPIVEDASFDLCRNQRLRENLIVLGNRSTNQVVSDLYDLYYCIIDLRYPGRGGSVVRSLHDPFGDGIQELVALFNGVLNGIHVWDNEGNVVADAGIGDGAASPWPSWEKEIQEVNMRGLGIADLDGDGEKELCVITSRGFIIVLTWTCEKRWAVRLPSDPLSIQALDCGGEADGRVVVGCREAVVYELDAQGAFRGRAQVNGSAQRMEKLGPSRYVVATTEGQAIAFDSR
jgi:hypothetical protein